MGYEFHTVSFIAFLEMRTIYYSLKNQIIMGQRIFPVGGEDVKSIVLPV